METAAARCVAGAAACVLTAGALAVAASARAPGLSAQAQVAPSALATHATSRPVALSPRSVTAAVPSARPSPVRAARPSPTAASYTSVVASSTRRVTESLAQRRVRLLAALDYPGESLGYAVVFAGPRAGYLGLTEPTLHRITIYVRSSQTDADLLSTLGHELGHAVDVGTLTEAQRAQYLRLRGLPPTTPWWSCSGCTDYSTGAGDFAEVFSLWLVGSNSFRSQLAGRPTAVELSRLAPLFS